MIPLLLIALSCAIILALSRSLKDRAIHAHLESIIELARLITDEEQLICMREALRTYRSERCRGWRQRAHAAMVDLYITGRLQAISYQTTTK